MDKEAVLNSLRRAVRNLRRAPGFFAAVIVTIGLSVGTVAAVFAIVHASLLNPLPYANPDQLLLITETTDDNRISSSYLNIRDWDERSEALEEVGFFVRRNVTVTGDGDAANVRALGVSENLFPLLGVDAALGRGVSAEANQPNGPSEAVLSHAFWNTRYGSNPDILGQTILLNGLPYAVVGVMPPGFEFPNGLILARSDVFVSVGDIVPAWVEDGRGSHPGIYAVGRMVDGIDASTAQSELSDIAEELKATYSDISENAGVVSEPILGAILGDLPEGLRLMAVAGLIVLLVGLGNAYGLFLARAEGQKRDLAVSRALGATGGSVAMQLLSVGLLVGLLAGGLALLVVGGIVRVFGPALASLPRLTDLSRPPAVIGFIFLLTILGALFVSVLPFLRSLRHGARIVTGTTTVGFSSRVARIRSMIVGGQIALAVVILTASILLARSFSVIADTNGGIQPEGVLTFRINLPAGEYDGTGLTEVFYGQLHEQILAIPGVTAAGGISTLPFSGSGAQSGMQPLNGALEEPVRTDVNVIFPDYLSALGVQLLAGRPFTPEDRDGSSQVVLVDESFAERAWPGENPLGKQVSGWGLDEATVVGVTGHVKNYGVIGESREELYMPHAQRPYLAMNMIVKSEADPIGLIAPIRSIITQLDPDIPMVGPRAMTAVVEETTSAPRLAASLGSMLAVLAGILAFLGAYALIAHSVAQRRREIGLRMALGAGTREVVRLILGSGARIGAVGSLVGLLATLAISRALEGFVFGISAIDPTSYIVAIITVMGAILLAAYLPAQRASSVDPLEALNSD